MRRSDFFIATALAVLAVLIWLTAVSPPSPASLLPALLFGMLIVFTDTFAVRLAGGAVSLLPMMTVAAYLVTGLVPTAWAALAGTVVYGIIRYIWAEQLGIPHGSDRWGYVGVNAANTTMHTTSILAGGLVFENIGRATRFPSAGVSLHAVPLILLCLTYLGTNYLIAGLYIAARGRSALQTYLRSLPNALFYEGAPLIFAPLVALIYTQLGVAQFVLFALLLVVSSLITRSLALTSRRLERRVKELGSVQAVGQALTASLNLDVILAAIHTQVAGLMPAHNFYVALYNAETEEVSFPLTIEDGQAVRWQSRRTGQGLTEHVLRTRKPLLIERDVDAALQQINIDQIGTSAVSWLGVPILAEHEPIGVIAVQSHTQPGAYDHSHLEILITIAAQAAVAIQNARLYERTDEALTRRVQELDSILRTTQEGVLLLDADWHILAANRALADFFGVAQTELVTQPLSAPLTSGESLVTMIGYTPQELRAACRQSEASQSLVKHAMVAPGPPERHVERTLTPVKDHTGTVTGWLLVFRDISEEIELARLREDMMHMLVHDLRSPLTVLKGSLDLIEEAVTQGKLEDVGFLQRMAQRGSDRILGIINELLDINKLESGELPLQRELIDTGALLLEVIARLTPMADRANISIDLTLPEELPPLLVDPAFTDRVFHNLLDNAIKFTPNDGHIELWARLDAGSNPASMLIGVRDTGPGIPAEEQHKVFAKFQQVASVEGRRRGTGLGLPFCRLAIEAHGGQIWVESKVGEGSTFVVRLPIADTGRVPPTAKDKQNNE